MENESKSFRVTCVVVGAGPAGYGAAMAVARGGVDVLLVERYGFTGGMGTVAGLNSYINYHYRGRDLSESVYRQMRDTLIRGGKGYVGDGGHVDFFEVEALKVYQENSFLQAGGKILYHRLLTGVSRVGDEWQLTLTGKGHEVIVRARYVIDASGDADACALAGARLTHGRKSDGKSQPMSMVVQLAGFDPQAWERAGNQLFDHRYASGGDCFAKEIRQAKQQGEWSIPRQNIAMWWSMPIDPTVVGINGTRTLGYDVLDAMDMTLAEIEGRRQAQELEHFFRKYIPGFADAYLLRTGPQIGIRESRRIIGLRTLDEASIMASEVPEDTVVYCSYPIDIHQPDNAGTDFDKATSDFMYGISYGCLLPAGLPNIAAAGRCISASHESAGSFRVMPTCMAIGEAAGTAVVIAASGSRMLSDVTGGEVRQVLDRSLDCQVLAERVV